MEFKKKKKRSHEHTRTHTHTHTHAHTHTHRDLNTGTPKPINEPYTHTCTVAHTHTHTDKNTHTQTLTNTHTHSLSYLHIQTHTPSAGPQWPSRSGWSPSCSKHNSQSLSSPWVDHVHISTIVKGKAMTTKPSQNKLIQSQFLLQTKGSIYSYCSLSL